MKNNLYRSKAILSSFDHFLTYYGLIRLRPYQLEAARAVLRSVLHDEGGTYVWKFARQGGKDETLAALYQYLMLLYSHRDISIVAAAPTFRPQIELAMHRLKDRLAQNIVLKREWAQHLGYIFRIRRARTLFLSADPSANVVGATAWPLLVINEAQDVLPAVYDRSFAPMAAANNATRLFCGTAWTSDTLLARTEALCRQLERQDGRKRVFLVDGPQIAAVHPPYSRFLDGEINRLGPDHPIVLSQYLCREIDAQASMFTPARLALMFSGERTSSEHRPHRSEDGPVADSPLQISPGPERSAGLGVFGEGGRSPVAQGGFEPPLRTPTPRGVGGVRPSAFLIDVAGMDEAALNLDGMGNPGRDSTTLTIVEIDLSTLATLQAPTYRVVSRETWTGTNHLTIFGQLKALAENWRPQHIVVDATGVGEGLWALLDRAFPTRVIPVKFTQSEKSEIGWRFLATIETGRYRDSSPNETVRLQYAMCRSEILPGPQKTLRWGVPDGSRGPDGALVHDDYVMADALVAILDKLDWEIHSDTLIIQAPDPLDDMSHIR